MYKRMILVAALALAGCQSAPEPTPTPTTPPSSAAVTAPQTPIPTTTVEDSAEGSGSPSSENASSFPEIPSEASGDEVAVREAVEAYWEVFARYAADPTQSDLTDTQLVTAPGSEESQVLLDQIAVLREEETRIVGDWQIRDLSVTFEDDSAIASYCLDRQGISLLSSESDDVIERGLPTMSVSMSVVPGMDGVWRVSSSRNAVETC